MNDMLKAIRGAAGTAEAIPTASPVKAEHPEIIAARERAFAKGREDVKERLGAILRAPGIHMNGKRMTAALDLAIKAPDMQADAVVDYVMSMPSDERAAQINLEIEDHDKPNPMSGLASWGIGDGGSYSNSFPDTKSIYAARRAQNNMSSNQDGEAKEPRSAAGKHSNKLPDAGPVYAARKTQ